MPTVADAGRALMVLVLLLLVVQDTVKREIVVPTVDPVVVDPRAGAPAAVPGPAATAGARARPNIVLITSDDMRPGDLRAMPFTRRWLGGHGVTFSDAISPFPLCCPARASILTGQYPHNHGVRSNQWPNGSYWAFTRQANTLPVWLKERGYRTAFVGKYLNEYASNRPSTLSGRPLFGVPPGWDHWHAMFSYLFGYRSVAINVDTPKQPRHQVWIDRYVTTVLTDRAQLTLRRLHDGRRPFFLWLSQVAPHGTQDGHWHPPIPHPRDVGRYDDEPLPQRPAYQRALNENTRDKRGPMHDLPRISVTRVRELYQRRLESLASLDRSVRRVVRVLRGTGELRRSVLIFTSDNGFALGEHRHVNKDRPYDAVLRVPLIIKAPGLLARYAAGPNDARVTATATATTMDLTATIVAAAGAEPRRRLDGVNLLRPRANPDFGRGDRVVLIESGAHAPYVTERSKFVGVRTDRWTRFGWFAMPEWADLHLGAREFYDRRLLPSQVTNIHGRQSTKTVERRLGSLTQEMWDCTGRSCVRALDAPR